MGWSELIQLEKGTMITDDQYERTDGTPPEEWIFVYYDEDEEQVIIRSPHTKSVTSLDKNQAIWWSVVETKEPRRVIYGEHMIDGKPFLMQEIDLNSEMNGHIVRHTEIIEKGGKCFQVNFRGEWSFYEIAQRDERITHVDVDLGDATLTPTPTEGQPVKGLV